MKAPRPAALILTAAALLLAALRESARLGAAEPGWIEPGGKAALATGCALLAFQAAGACLFGRHIALRVNAGARRAGLALWTFLYAYLFVVAGLALLGAAGWINAIGLTLLSALPLLLCRNAPGRPGHSRALAPEQPGHSCAEDGRAEPGPAGVDETRPFSAGAFLREYPTLSLVIAAAGLLTVANVAWSFVLPPFAHDDFTYHLVFPVEWMQSGTLNLRDVPFGNHSPPYYPMDTELFYLWLLIPFRAVFHITAAQSVFLLVSVIALYEIFRRCGAARGASAAAASLFAFSPVVVAELSKAYVDVAFCCFFLVALNAALAFHRAPSGGKAIQFAAALGLFAGTKIPGLVFSLLILLPLFATLLIAAQRRMKKGPAGPESAATDTAGSSVAAVNPPGSGRIAAIAAAAAALFLVAGGWWYGRNLVVTGNPVFPLNVDLFGISLFDGAYDRDALPPSHIATLLDLHSFYVIALLAVGALFTLAAAGFSRRATGFSRRATGFSRRAPEFSQRAVLPRRALLAGLLLPAAMAAIFHGLLPFDYARFVLALGGLAGALVLVPLDNARFRVAGVAFLAVITALFLNSDERSMLLLPLLEARLVSCAEVWLSFAAAALALILAAALALVPMARAGRTAVSLLLALTTLAAFIGAGAVSDRGGESFTDAFRKSREPYILLDEAARARRDGEAQARVDGEVPGATVAFAGTNRSFLLYGRHFSNRVLHVNVNRCPGWRFHDHVLRFTGDRTALRKDRNAVGYTRANASYRAWEANLAAAGADFLFVERLTPWNLEKGYRRDAQGFPLEAIWADRHPGKFRRIFASPAVRIYEILP